MNAQRSRWPLWTLGLCVAAVVGIAAYEYDQTHGPDDPVLRAILSERLASITPPRGRAVFVFQSETSSFLGKPGHAKIQKTWAFADQATADVAQQQLMRQAQASGWIALRVSGDVHSAWKEINGRWTTLSIGDFDKNGEVHVTMDIEDCQCLHTG